MGFRNPIVVADQISSGNFAGNYTIAGSFIVGNPAASHVLIGTDAHGADGVRLYGSDGVTPLIDLNISATPTITGALIRTATSGQRVELSNTAASLVSFYSGNALETAPGTIGSQIIGGTLYTNVTGPKAGSAAPPQLQLYNTGTDQSAVINAPAGQASMMSKSWSLNFDGAYTGGGAWAATPTLIARFARVLIGQNSTTPYVYLQFTDSANTERAFIGLAPVLNAWYTGTVANDLVIGNEAGQRIFCAGTVRSTQATDGFETSNVAITQNCVFMNPVTDQGSATLYNKNGALFWRGGTTGTIYQISAGN